jgi:hypothetical protein
MINPCACRLSGVQLKNTRLYNRNGRHARLFFQAFAHAAWRCGPFRQGQDF